MQMSYRRKESQRPHPPRKATLSENASGGPYPSFVRKGAGTRRLTKGRNSGFADARTRGRALSRVALAYKKSLYKLLQGKRTKEETLMSSKRGRKKKLRLSGPPVGTWRGKCGPGRTPWRSSRKKRIIIKIGWRKSGEFANTRPL